MVGILHSSIVQKLTSWFNWKVNEKLDTELREFSHYIFQRLLETCNQELNTKMWIIGLWSQFSNKTEFKYYDQGVQKKAYLNPYLDLFNNEMISFDISKRPTYKSVSTALKHALTITSDCAYRKTFHSDQCFAYQMKNYGHLLKSHHVIQSMSRKDNCHDNAVMENFFGLLKQEIYYGRVFH